MTSPFSVVTYDAATPTPHPTTVLENFPNFESARTYAKQLEMHPAFRYKEVRIADNTVVPVRFYRT